MPSADFSPLPSNLFGPLCETFSGPLLGSTGNIHVAFADLRIASIVSRMSTSTDTTANPADAIKAQASEAVRKVSETINDQANVLRDTAQSARYNTQDFIENNPWQSVAIAAGVGLLIGIIIARR